jgi:hypothetical protein
MQETSARLQCDRIYDLPKVSSWRGVESTRLWKL